MAKIRKKIPKPKLEDVLPKYRSPRVPTGSHQCNHCQGVGRVVAPGEVSDPIEGHKLSMRIDCPDCNGKGYVPEKIYKQILSEKISEWKENEPIRKEIVDKLKSILNKLTDEELNLVKDFVTCSTSWPTDYRIWIEKRRKNGELS